jgi:hypothetical protein
MFFLAVNPRVWLIIGLLFLYGLARRVYRDWRRRLGHERGRTPRMPASLLDGADRTWVVFTAPRCKSCDGVARELRTSDPGARVVKVDATAEPHLAAAFRVRSSPTVVLADGSGRVGARLVGADAVTKYLRTRAG